MTRRRKLIAIAFLIIFVVTEIAVLFMSMSTAP